MAPDDDGYEVALAGGRTIRARRLLVATGLVDELPGIPGLPDRWGRDVVHCPYCHGWEVRDQAIGVLATGPLSVHQALLFRQLSDDVTFFPNTRPLAGEESEQLAACKISVVDGQVASIEIDVDRLTGVKMSDGTLVRRQVLAVSPRMAARAGFLAGLGLTLAPHPADVGEYIPADPAGRTDMPGVWVAGNVTDLTAHVGGAAAAGALAAAQINADLVAEETIRSRRLPGPLFTAVRNELREQTSDRRPSPRPVNLGSLGPLTSAKAHFGVVEATLPVIMEWRGEALRVARRQSVVT